MARPKNPITRREEWRQLVEDRGSFRLWYNEGNPQNRRYHIRGEVDGIPVARYWSRKRQGWEYVCLSPSFHLVYLTDPERPYLYRVRPPQPPTQGQDDDRPETT